MLDHGVDLLLVAPAEDVLPRSSIRRRSSFSWRSRSLICPARVTALATARKSAMVSTQAWLARRPSSPDSHVPKPRVRLDLEHVREQWMARPGGPPRWPLPSPRHPVVDDPGAEVAFVDPRGDRFVVRVGTSSERAKLCSTRSAAPFPLGGVRSGPGSARPRRGARRDRCQGRRTAGPQLQAAAGQIRGAGWRLRSSALTPWRPRRLCAGRTSFR